MKKERATTSDEQRERVLIAEQIERAATESETLRDSSEEQADKPSVEEGLKRDEGEKLVLSFSSKPKPDGESPSSTSTPTPPAIGLKLSAAKPAANPLKRPNVFKMASSKPAPEKEGSLDKKRKDGPSSAVEKLILEDQERKRRKMERDAGRV